MKIKKIKIKKFRGFEDISFELGTNLTAIAGQNGTQKTTALGILSQTFSITDKSNPMYNEKPLSGGNFKSAFAEKFKLSEEKDKPKEHEWSLYLDDQTKPYTIQSILRNKKSNEIRFWKKGDKSEGSGYLPLPVIYLSLNRLIPIGEDSSINVGDIQLTNEEKTFCERYHKKILLIQDTFDQTSYLESKTKNTLGVSTSKYDWKQNSAGQDNIGKILLAILSFRRLKERYPTIYPGGILAIDELEATLYPASQEKLIDFLSEFSETLNLQIFFTTHSLEILRKLSPKNKKPNNKNRIVFFKKEDDCFKPYDNCTYEDIVDILNATSSIESKPNRLKIYCEDEEARCFAKQIFGTNITRHLSFETLDLGNNEYISLVKRKIPEFSSSHCIILLDGDFDNIPKKFNHIMSLPGNLSPEKLLANFLNSLGDTDNIWSNIGRNYNKIVCFRNYPFDEILEDRIKAKKWFNEQKDNYWKRNAYKVINPWIKNNKKIVESFIITFKEKYNNLAIKLNLKKIQDE